jgi:hypothetical protein
VRRRKFREACVRCSMLPSTPKMLPRLNEFGADLENRRDRAVAEGRLGEIEGIDLTLRFLHDSEPKPSGCNGSLVTSTSTCQPSGRPPDQDQVQRSHGEFKEATIGRAGRSARGSVRARARGGFRAETRKLQCLQLGQCPPPARWRVLRRRRQLPQEYEVRGARVIRPYVQDREPAARREHHVPSRGLYATR